MIALLFGKHKALLHSLDDLQKWHYCNRISAKPYSGIQISSKPKINLFLIFSMF